MAECSFVSLPGGAVLCRSSDFSWDALGSGRRSGSIIDIRAIRRPRRASPLQSDKKKKKSSEPATAKLRIEVASPDGKPVGNASVYVRFNETVGLFHKNKLAEMSFKTNQDGSVKVTDVPQGKILIQVIAKGWHTFGKWYDIETDSETVQIKLEAPPHWY